LDIFERKLLDTPEPSTADKRDPPQTVDSGRSSTRQRLVAALDRIPAPPAFDFGAWRSFFGL
jgi:hypothetical protein